MSAVRRPLLARVLLAVLALVVLVFVVSTLPGVRAREGFWVPVDGWLQGSGYVIVAALVVLRAALLERDRVLWGLLAAAVTARAAGFVVHLSWVRLQQPQPSPSVSDGFWIVGSLLLVAALATRVRHDRAPAVSRLLALDGMVGALAAAGLGLAVVYPVLVAASAPGTPRPAIATTLAYPLLDVVVLVVVTGLVVSGCRTERSDVLLLTGVVVTSAVDVTYLLLLSQGTWRPGTVVSALSLVGTALVGLAAWASVSDLQQRTTPPAGQRPEEPMSRSVSGPGVTWTAVLAVVCLVGLLVVELSTRRPSLVAMLLLTAGVVVGLLRGLLTLREDQQEADARIGSSALERERFAALVEASSDFIAIADLDGRLLYLNPAGRALTGIDRDADVRGMSYEVLRPEHEVERSRTVALPQLRSTGHFESSTWLRHQRGGPAVPVLSHSFVMRSPRSGKAFALGSIQRDVTDVNAAHEELRRLAEEQQQLLTRLVQAQDDERARIASDVHDDSVQALAAVQLRLGLLERQLDAVLDDEQRHWLTLVEETLEGATARLRHLLFDLESPARRTDLVAALEEAASYVLGGTDVTWAVDGPRSDGLPEAVRVTAYRVAKEALVNVRKHAGATHVRVDVRYEQGGVTITVLDDGHGIAADHDEARPGHLGLASMRDRARVAGGHLEVDACPDGGTRLQVWLPTPSGQVC